MKRGRTILDFPFHVLFLVFLATKNNYLPDFDINNMIVPLIQSAELKCANINPSAIVPGHIMNYLNNGTVCRKRFICSETWGMAAAHVIGQSNCISSFTSFYFECINSTWFIDIDNKPIGQIDQVFCYKNDESNRLSNETKIEQILDTCSKSTPLPILDPNVCAKMKFNSILLL